MGIVSDVPTTFITLSISTIASVIPASIFEGLSIMFKEAFQSNSSTINGNELKIILEEGPSLITNSSMKAGLSFGGYNSKGGALGLSHKSGHLDEADAARSIDTIARVMPRSLASAATSASDMKQ